MTSNGMQYGLSDLSGDLTSVLPGESLDLLILQQIRLGSGHPAACQTTIRPILDALFGSLEVTKLSLLQEMESSGPPLAP